MSISSAYIKRPDAESDMEKKDNMVVAISRQIASGGSFIAYSVARKLKFKYLDNEVLYRAAKFMGVDSRELAGREERLEGFISKIAKSFCFGSPEAAFVYPSGLPVYDINLFDIETKIITEIAGSCSIVVVGRAGHYIMRGHPGLVKVFVHAPLDFRVRRLMEIRNIKDKDIVSAEIRKTDERRENFLRNQTGLEWTDARNYDLCIDASVTGFDQAAEMIVELAGKIRRNLYLKQR